jgi:hypothetical protein
MYPAEAIPFPDQDLSAVPLLVLQSLLICRGSMPAALHQSTSSPTRWFWLWCIPHKGTVDSSLTFNPIASGWTNRRWWASTGLLPQVRQDCDAANWRWALPAKLMFLKISPRFPRYQTSAQEFPPQHDCFFPSWLVGSSRMKRCLKTAYTRLSVRLRAGSDDPSRRVAENAL